MTLRQALSIVARAVLVIAAAVSIRAQDPAPAPAPPSTAPSVPAPQTPATPEEPRAISRDRIRPPRMVTRVAPVYNAEAMRARIEGTVTLRGVVELDGSMSGIEVVKSLDTMYGLDQAAIDALKQWRFEPATLDGKPVRTVITVNQTFTLSQSAPVQAWPDAFSAAPPASQATEEALDVNGIRLKVSRPPRWTMRRDGPPNEWFGMRSPDGVHWVSVLRPETAPFDLRWPTAPELIARIAESVRRARAQTSPDAQTLATGQIQTSLGFWVWSTLRLPTVPNPSGVTTEQNPFGEAHMWMFTQTPGGRVVGVSCMVLIPRGLTSDAIDARIRYAAEQFAPIINSISLEVLQG